MSAKEFLTAHGIRSGEFINKALYLKENWLWMKYSYAVAIRVRSRMEEIGWTQKQLAEALNCTQQHVSTILKGNANMTLETLAKLERALQFDLIGTALTIFPDSSVSIGFLNSPEPNENTDAVHTSTLVDGYKPRKKKGPKRNSTKQ